ncbi:hypothetical protein PFMALIP_02145 [Plasmodium falciparum MaliPS096_E11]|uniref:Uncharacterized protein n=1 Tax=Plasmodium falciparum MaliPS096_E11 TaxID=1036727 RepID=A0A024WTF1_PLAFA|nr:hypothetical protein PFMALIP_02145 [Plasmodium falciparum MaliPS096_E11]
MNSILCLPSDGLAILDPQLKKEKHESQVIFLLLDFTLNVNIVFTHIYLLILFFLILFEYRKKFSERAPFYNNIYNA